MGLSRAGSNPASRILKMKFFLFFFLTLKPIRLVSLAPSITEIVYYLKIDTLLVGNTIYCNYPEDAKKKIHVGDLINPNIETIKKLNPDYVLLISPMQDRIGMKLKKAGLLTLSCKQNNLMDIADCMKKIGKLVGDTTGYEKFIEKLNKIDSLPKPKKRPKVLFILSQRPMYSAGKNTFLNEIISKSGGKNAANFKGYKMISPEKIRFFNPDIIVLVGYKTDPKGFSEKLGIKETKAVKENCIFKVNADVFTRPGPRVINAILKLNKIVIKCTKDGKN